MILMIKIVKNILSETLSSSADGLCSVVMVKLFPQSRYFNIKAALLIFIVTIDQMTTCNLKGVTRNERKSTELSPKSTVSLSFTEHFSFFSAHFCFCFADLYFHICVVSHGSVRKSSKNPPGCNQS